MKGVLERDDCIIVDGSGRARVRKKRKVTDRTVWDKTTGVRLPGVGRTPSGKYDCKITHPIRRKTVWIGTFSTPEEATAAYVAKKREFDAARAGDAREFKADKGFEWVEVAEEDDGSNLQSEKGAEVEAFGSILEEPVDLLSDHLHKVSESARDDESQPSHDQKQREPYSGSIQEPESSSSEQVETEKETQTQPSEPTPDEHHQSSPETEQSPGSTHESECSSDGPTGTKSQTVSEPTNEFGETQPETPESCKEPSTKEEGMQVITVKSQYYNGGGAMGYLIPSPDNLSSKGGKSGSLMKIFVPIVDFHGHLLGKFSEIDEDLNITDEK